MATGTATLNFGPITQRKSYASADVTTPGLAAGTYIEAFMQAESSAEHSADENRIDRIDLVCEYINSTTLRIHGTVSLGTTYGNKPIRWVTAT